MKAAVIQAAGATPVFADFPEPSPQPGLEVIHVTASALSNLSKARSSGAHYSSSSLFPAVAGVDGVGLTSSGRRVYFALPEAPFGALAEQALVRSDFCIDIPDEVDDVTAAALANPGMSAWAALMERARLQPGETVLIHGATGTAGRIAVQLAKHLGAGKVLATGRNARELEELRALGADVLLPFHLENHPEGAEQFEQALRQEFAHGIDVVVDYLYGPSALAIILAIAKSVDDGHPVRFVHVGAAAGAGEISLPGAALRSSAIELMGSGLKSVPMPRLLESIRQVFLAAKPAALQINTRVAPLSTVEAEWPAATGKPRLVFTLP